MVRYEDGEHTIHITQLYSVVDVRRRCHNKEYYSGYGMPYTPQKSEQQALQFQALGGVAPLSAWLDGGMPDMNPILPLFQPTTRGDQLH